MAEPTEQPPTEQPAGEQAAAPTSKKGAKKAEAKAKKEALKAARAAELAAAAAKVTLEDDPAQDSYGNKKTVTGLFSKDAEEVEIRNLNESHNGKTVVVRAWLQNSRVQSAKMGFVELRKGSNWNIQGVVMASDEEPIVSRRMVKWITSIHLESFIAVEAKVKQPLEPVKSCRVSGLELHITKCYVLSPAPAMLGMTMAAASQPIVNFSDEKPTAEEADKAPAAASESTAPSASMLTHLDNIAMHKRAPIQQAIMVWCCESLPPGFPLLTCRRISAFR
jgi:aspartyl-tRNA synthetase